MAPTAPEVVCVGQSVIDCISRGIDGDLAHDRIVRAEEVTLSTGGDATNESFVLASLGHRVRLVCGVGQDLAGDTIIGEAERRGVDTSWITASPDLTTPIAPLLLRTDADRTSVNAAAARLEGYVPPADALEGARVVSLASLFRAPLDTVEGVSALVRRAHEQGSLVCCDTTIPNYREIGFADLAEVLPMIDYIFPNDREALHFTGTSTPEDAADALRAMGVRNVVVKLGEKGVLVRGEQGSLAYPARTVEVVDTTGAGDNFVAGFISGLLRGLDLEGCCESGTAQGAAAVGRMGACPPLARS